MRYAEALEVVPRTIAENSGLNATDAVAALYTAHAAGQTSAGLDVETGACSAGRPTSPEALWSAAAGLQHGPLTGMLVS